MWAPNNVEVETFEHGTSKNYVPCFREVEYGQNARTACDTPMPSFSKQMPGASQKKQRAYSYQGQETTCMQRHNDKHCQQAGLAQARLTKSTRPAASS